MQSFFGANFPIASHPNSTQGNCTVIQVEGLKSEIFISSSFALLHQSIYSQMLCVLFFSFWNFHHTSVEINIGISSKS
jgi:hypothetical protein